MGLCKDNASDFSPEHPWAGGGSRGRLHIPELAQMCSGGSNWGDSFSVTVSVCPQTLTRATVWGAESLGSFSPVVLCMGEISDCQLAVVLHD